ncbi:hypothetical protein [Nibribacter koreensis]|uniref:Uncharacterized protein n=1 Tax=Nibribacter koreensis TaxID=1084519 RepID=A0ABP8FKV7_9BACT
MLNQPSSPQLEEATYQQLVTTAKSLGFDTTNTIHIDKGCNKQWTSEATPRLPFSILPAFCPVF